MSKEKKDTKKFTNETGDVTVSETVISSVVRTAVLEVEGVHSIFGNQAGMIDLIAVKSMKKGSGIKVNIKGNAELSIEVALILRYGSNVIEVSKVVQEKVKESVESLIGMHVKDIDIVVEQIMAAS